MGLGFQEEKHKPCEERLLNRRPKLCDIDDKSYNIIINITGLNADDTTSYNVNKT